MRRRRRRCWEPFPGPPARFEASTEAVRTWVTQVGFGGCVAHPDVRVKGPLTGDPLGMMRPERDTASVSFPSRSPSPHGSGPGGRVVKADVEAALASGSAPTSTIPPLLERSVPPAPAERLSAPSLAQAGNEVREHTASGPPPVAARSSGRRGQPRGPPRSQGDRTSSKSSLLPRRSSNGVTQRAESEAGCVRRTNAG